MCRSCSGRKSACSLPRTFARLFRRGAALATGLRLSGGNDARANYQGEAGAQTDILCSVKLNQQSSRRKSDSTLGCETVSIRGCETIRVEVLITSTRVDPANLVVASGTESHDEPNVGYADSTVKATFRPVISGSKRRSKDAISICTHPSHKSRRSRRTRKSQRGTEGQNLSSFQCVRRPTGNIRDHDDQSLGSASDGPRWVV